jgi:hypothetical protein
VTVRVTDVSLNFTDETFSVIITGGTPDYFEISGQTQLVVNTTSDNFTITIFDQFGNITTVRSRTTIWISSSTGTEQEFTPAIIVFEIGESTKTFTYRDIDLGAYTFTANAVSGDKGLVGDVDTFDFTIVAPSNLNQANVSSQNNFNNQFLFDYDLNNDVLDNIVTVSGLMTELNNAYNFTYTTQSDFFNFGFTIFVDIFNVGNTTNDPDIRVMIADINQLNAFDINSNARDIFIYVYYQGPV